MSPMNDVDAVETREWLDALDSVEAFEGVGRVDELLSGVVQAARRKGARLVFAANTAYAAIVLRANHRVIDGAAAARFSRHIATVLEDVRRLVL